MGAGEFLMEKQAWYDKAIRDHEKEHGPSGGGWNISMILQRLHAAAPRPASDHPQWNYTAEDPSFL